MVESELEAMQPAPEPIGSVALYDLKKLPRLVISNEVESHTVVASLVATCAVLCDVLSAHDPLPGEVDAPGSLRVTSLV